eukprot:489900_1
MGDSARSCDISWDIYMISFCIIDGIVCLSNIAMLYKFIKHHKSEKETERMNQRLFWVAAIFMFFVIFTQIFMLALVAGPCQQIEEMETHDHIFSFLWIFCYIFQSYMLSMVIFMTLRDSVNGTPFEPSKCTVIAYKIIYVVIAIFAIFTAIGGRLDNGQSDLGGILLIFTLFFLAILFISTLVLYIRKLMAIYKNIDSDESLITKITKLALLSIISISVTLIIPIIMIAILSTNPHYVLGSAVFTFFVLIDTTSNLISITLTFPYFDSYYVKMCGCLHRRCFVSCAKCLGQQQRLLMDHQQ